MRPHGCVAANELRAGDIFVTPSRTITESDIASFAAWSWDTNPVHTDAVFAAGSRFGSRIAHGMLGLSLVMGLVSRLGIFEGSSVAMLGIEDWRFLAPVVGGDTVRVRLEIISVRQTSDLSSAVVDRRAELLDLGGVVVQSGRLPLLMTWTFDTGIVTDESP